MTNGKNVQNAEEVSANSSHSDDFTTTIVEISDTADKTSERDKSAIIHLQHMRFQWPQSQKAKVQSLAELVDKILASWTPESNFPLLIHSPDGADLTGVVMATTTLMYEVKKRSEKKLSVYDAVLKLRSSRPGMVCIK